MPEFTTLSVDQAKAKAATRKQAELLREYSGYIGRLESGGAGSLKLLPGETTQAIRRRLGKAAKSEGKALAVRRTVDTVYSGSQMVPVGEGGPAKLLDRGAVCA